MRVLDPGHQYALANLRGGGETVVRYHKDPDLHEGDGYDGPSCQEQIRGLIDRIQVLDAEKPYPGDLGNDGLIQRAREMIAIFEMRALWYKVAKGDLAIERLPIGADGHIMFVVEALTPETRDGEGEGR